MNDNGLDALTLARLDLRGTDTRDVADVLPRARLDIAAAMSLVEPIVHEVATGGVPALLDIAERFDGVRPPGLRVPAEVLQRALDELDPATRDALAESVARLREVHRQQRRTPTTAALPGGGSVTQTWVPVDRVGLYVPGGKAVYVSSVAMNVVPAQEAGVPSLAIASPPRSENGGWPAQGVLAAAALLGVDEVYAAGGAQAIAMFAHGASDADGTLVCRPVALVTGPGNVYVAAAKRLLRGRVGIDAEAGPTEVAIIADDSADPTLVAADLISQAEHDTLAAAVLITDSPALADAVDARLRELVPRTRHAERVLAALRGEQSGVVLVDDEAAAVQVANGYGAEHLEIQTRDPQAMLAGIRNAGAVFLGAYSPVSLGDYLAGSNHVLPTGGTARHSSGLSVQSFLKGVQVIDFDRDALRAVHDGIQALSGAEDLPAHGAAVTARFP